jgi:hypothetical protein
MGASSPGRDVPDSIANTVTLYWGSRFIDQVGPMYFYNTATGFTDGHIMSYGDGTYYGFGYVTVYFSQVPTQINFGNSVSG